MPLPFLELPPGGSLDLILVVRAAAGMPVNICEVYAQSGPVTPIPFISELSRQYAFLFDDDARPR